MPIVICNAFHVSILADYAARHGIGLYKVPGLSAPHIGERLHEANVAAFRHAFGDQDYPPFRFDYRATDMALPPIQILKAVECQKKNSRHHPDWRASEAKYLLDQIAQTAVRHLPGYRDAAWELRPHVVPMRANDGDGYA